MQAITQIFQGLLMGLFVLAMLGCKAVPPSLSEVAAGQGAEEQWIYCGPRLQLSEDDLAKLEVRANSGDVAAANKLADFYLMKQRDIPKVIHWWRVAGERGVVDAQFNVGTLLLEQKDEKARQEGVRWLQKAAQNGSEYAQRALERLARDSQREVGR